MKKIKVLVNHFLNGYGLMTTAENTMVLEKFELKPLSENQNPFVTFIPGLPNWDMPHLL